MPKPISEVSMVERISRALCHFDGHPEDTKFEGKPMWRSYEDQARAVLAAMRAPNVTMVLACADLFGSQVEHWQRSIDAALAEDI